MINMLQNVGLVSVLGALALNVPHIDRTATAPEPTTLSGYVEAAQNGTLQPDPIVSIAKNLCPVISESAEGEGAMSQQIAAACTLLQSADGADANDLMAMLN